MLYCESKNKNIYDKTSLNRLEKTMIVSRETDRAVHSSQVFEFISFMRTQNMDFCFRTTLLFRQFKK